MCTDFYMSAMFYALPLLYVLPLYLLTDFQPFRGVLYPALPLRLGPLTAMDHIRDTMPWPHDDNNAFENYALYWLFTTILGAHLLFAPGKLFLTF